MARLCCAVALAVAALALAVCGASAAPTLQDEVLLRAQFEAFVKTYGKVYATAEEAEARFGVFAANIARAAELTHVEGEDATYGVTKFSDMTSEEFRSRFLTYKHADMDLPLADFSGLSVSIPRSYDWRSKPNAVTPVKDQGDCGSCWAFSTVENVESVWAIQGNHTLTKLSVQQVVDCDTGDNGCDGGDTEVAMRYVIANGIATEAAYPYVSGDGNTTNCTYAPSQRYAHISSYVYITRDKNETLMAIYLYNNAPLSICVDAATWQHYKGGIVKKSCGKDLGHCVMVTGYNRDGDTPYWIIRNSWSTDWGEQGYIYVEMGEDECGVGKAPISALV